MNIKWNKFYCFVFGSEHYLFFFVHFSIILCVLCQCRWVRAFGFFLSLFCCCFFVFLKLRSRIIIISNCCFVSQYNDRQYRILICRPMPDATSTTWRWFYQNQKRKKNEIIDWDHHGRTHVRAFKLELMKVIFNRMLISTNQQQSKVCNDIHSFLCIKALWKSIAHNKFKNKNSLFPIIRYSNDII